MKSQRTARKATWFSLSAAYILVAIILMHASAAPVAVRSGLGRSTFALSALNTSKTFLQNFRDPQHDANGRYLFNKSMRLARPFLAGVGSTLFQVSEAVQTFDIFAPTPAFTPGPAGTSTDAATNPLTPMNLFPVWTASQRFILFASNRPSGVAGDPAGNYHIWAALQDGSAAAVQITSGPGNEFYPALSSGDQQLAFVSDANSPGVRNLYTIPVSSYLQGGTAPAPTNVSTLGSSQHSGAAVRQDPGQHRRVHQRAAAHLVARRQ